MNKGFNVDDLFSDGMVLQRNQKNKLYGYDLANYKVTIDIDGQSYKTLSDDKGYWELELNEYPSGGPYGMSISGSEQRTIEAIYFGDVFLLAGQSNIELPLSRVYDLYQQELEEAMDRGGDGGRDTYRIHQFTMPKEALFEKKSARRIEGEWVTLNESSLDIFSAVGYFFAKTYSKENDNVHVGLIQCGVGGSPIEAWCDEAILGDIKPEMLETIQECRDEQWVQNQITKSTVAVEQWNEQCDAMDDLKESYKVSNDEWQKWPTLNIPCIYDEIENLRGMSGVVWLKRELNLTVEEMNDMTGEDLWFRFGTIVDADSVWINGEHIGTTDYQYPPRQYKIKHGLLKVGRNIITLKHIVTNGHGEFTAGKPIHLRTSSKKFHKSLRGAWHYQVGARMHIQPSGSFFTWQPTALYHSMIYPLRRMSLAGVLWYQGESNVEIESRESLYSKLIERMIAMYRWNFSNDRLPICCATLAGFGDGQRSIEPGIWAQFRHVQMEVLKSEEVAVASAIDLGEFNDIHPLRKKTLGIRFAKVMKALLSGEDSHTRTLHLNNLMGPELAFIESVGDGWLCRFNYVGDGLYAKGRIVFGIQLESGWQQVEGEIIDKGTIKVENPHKKSEVSMIHYNYVDYPMYHFSNSLGSPCRPFLYKMEKIEQD